MLTYEELMDKIERAKTAFEAHGFSTETYGCAFDSGYLSALIDIYNRDEKEAGR